MNMLTEAAKWVSLGIAVIPMHYRSKRYPVVKWTEFQQRLPTEQELKNWFEHRHRNIAVVAGWQGLTVLDFDSLEAFATWLNWATTGESEAKLLAQYTCAVLTSRGVHVYTILPKAVNSFSLAIVQTEQGLQCEHFDQTKHQKSQLLDIRSKGAICLIPPSVHPSGSAYQWLKDSPILAVSSLEAILPPIVQQYTEQSNVKPVSIDPWQAANQVRQGGGSSIEKIKQGIPILSFFPKAQASGPEWFKDHCPFHPDDSHASLMIKPAEGFCVCRTCGNGKTWDVINVYAKLRNLSNSEAIAQLGQLVK